LILGLCEDDPSTVFFLKLKADYYRYKCEYSNAQNDIDDAKKCYELATEKAEKMKPTEPIKLGLILNKSVFYYEVLGLVEKACSMAKHSFDEAIAMIEELDDQDYRDSTTIM